MPKMHCKTHTQQPQPQPQRPLSLSNEKSRLAKGRGSRAISPPLARHLGALDPPENGTPLGAGWEGSPGGRRRRPPPLRRTPTGIQRNCNASFKSPVPSLGASHPPDKDALEQEIEKLKKNQLVLDDEIAQLLAEGYSLEELENHIALLHEYNEIKDVGQMLLGRLAVIRGVTTKEIYPEFGLDLND
uniref:DNA repair protein SWI5 homolog n=1 Tax=Pogona vitticeps TaxID=103695 RepID=A0ABM5F767_9SAUR